MSTDYTDAILSAVGTALAATITYPGNGQPTFVREAVGGGHAIVRTDLPDGRTMIVSNGDAVSTWTAPHDRPRVHLAIYDTVEWDQAGNEVLSTWATDNGLDPTSMEDAVAQALGL